MDDGYALALANAITELSALETQLENLREKLHQASTEAGSAKEALAAANAKNQGLEALLAVERDAKAQAMATLDKVLAAMAARTGEGPEYSVLVGERDRNGRMQTLTIRPKGGK